MTYKVNIDKASVAAPKGHSKKQPHRKIRACRTIRSLRLFIYWSIAAGHDAKDFRGYLKNFKKTGSFK